MRELLNDLQPDEKKELHLEGHTINAVRYDDLSSDERESLTAVDGGSAVILQTTRNCVLFVRIISATMQARKEIRKTEGYVLANADKTVTFYPLNGEKEELFRAPETKESLETLAGLGRKLLEWRAVDAAPGLVLWDGSLTPTNDVEEKHLPKKDALLGVSKTTGTLGNWRAFSDAPKQAWKARAFGDVWFVKLHEQAKHYFRVDTKQSELIDKLVPWSCDPSFIGYPYPLILADQLARVSKEEAATQKIRLQATAGKNWDALAEGSSASDAHAILDSLQF